MSEEHSSSHLVVIGSSAGGIEALSELVSTLPEEFPAPIVVAQHLDPAHKSHLEQILSRRSTLPVRTIEDHGALEAGVVFVVPANRHVNITDAEIDLQEDSTGRPKPSIDRLMGSASEVYGERLIAVVLTGTGSDGTEGARVVRKAGGTVVIQDPETAEFGGMPGSIAPNTVDIVASLERIGPVLKDLIANVEVPERMPPAKERQELEKFLESLRERHGVDFTSYKTPTIMRRLKRRIVATNTQNIEEYSRYLENNPEEYRQLVNTFLIKVTEFFRNPELFAYLKEKVLPEIIEEVRKNNRQLRVWSAGCATGEEAYTLAILLSEILGEEAGLFDVRIFATDVDEDAVNFARHGIYPASALGNLSEEQIKRYFVKQDGQYHVKKQVRSMIVFGEHDLARRSPFPRIDLVVSRNVLIYFTTELQRRALQLFAYSLRDGGCLVLGKAESVSPLGEFFTQEDRHHKVYKRRGERFLMPPNLSVSPALQQRQERGRSATAGVRPSSEPRDTQRPRAAEENALNQIPVGVVVVDRRYDIQTINAAARRLLSIRNVAVGEDFLHLIQNVPYQEVRQAVDAAFRDGQSAYTEEFAIEEVATGETRYLQLVCHPRREEGTEGQKGMAEAVTVVVNDVTETARARRGMQDRLESVRTEFEWFKREAEAEAERKKQQNQRLVETNQHLEETNQEMANLNQELQVANEEAQLNTEEAQASTEEVETLNEELQATNEELETLNEELQATVEELNTTNDDLQARTMELQDMARAAEEERSSSEASNQRIEAVLSGMSDPVLAVDAEGEVLFTNLAFQQTFGEIRPDLSAAELLGDHLVYDENREQMPPEAAPRARAARGESFDMRFFTEQQSGEWRRFDARARPFDGAGGGVIVIREVAE